MARPAANTITVATPERILAAAEQEFSSLGFGGGTLATIAKGAQITRASLLHHFRSKEELYAATVQRAFADISAVLVNAIAKSGTFEERLRGVLHVFTQFCGQRPGVARLIVRELIERSGPGRNLLLEQAAPLLDYVEAFIRTDGAEVLRKDVPIRAALLRVIADILLRESSADLRVPLWGETARDADWDLVRIQFLRDVN